MSNRIKSRYSYGTWLDQNYCPIIETELDLRFYLIYLTRNCHYDVNRIWKYIIPYINKGIKYEDIVSLLSDGYMIRNESEQYNGER